jgi:predicted kinase
MPSIIMLVGLPGSGKTTYRDKFIKDVFCSNPLVISQDDLVEAYAAENNMTYTQAFKTANLKDFQRQVKQVFVEAIADGRTIILDRTNLTVKTRKSFLYLVPAHYRKIAIVFDVHPLVLEDRLERRAAATGKFIPDFVIDQMRRSYTAPTQEEFDHIVYEQTQLASIALRIRSVFRKGIRFMKQIADKFKAGDK